MVDEEQGIPAQADRKASPPATATYRHDAEQCDEVNIGRDGQLALRRVRDAAPLFDPMGAFALALCPLGMPRSFENASLPAELVGVWMQQTPEPVELVSEANRRSVPGARDALERMLPLLGLDSLLESGEEEAPEEAEALLREREEAAAQQLVLLEVDAGDADASADDGIWIGDRRVGFVTSGAYGHHVKKSLALAYVDRDVIEPAVDLDVYIVGEARTARILPAAPYDPTSSKLRG